MGGILLKVRDSYVTAPLFTERSAFLLRVGSRAPIRPEVFGPMCKVALRDWAFRIADAILGDNDTIRIDVLKHLAWSDPMVLAVTS